MNPKFSTPTTGVVNISWIVVDIYSMVTTYLQKIEQKLKGVKVYVLDEEKFIL